MRLVDTSIDIDAPPEVVFDLFTTSRGLERWMAVEAVVDLRPGGAWRWVHENGDACSGEYVDIDPPHTLSFTYGWEGGRFADIAPGSTRVDVSFRPHLEGTRVVLRHRGLTGAAVDQHANGWNHFLGRLALEAGDRRLELEHEHEHRHGRNIDGHDG